MNLQIEFNLIKHCQKLIKSNLVLMVEDYSDENIVKFDIILKIVPHL